MLDGGVPLRDEAFGVNIFAGGHAQGVNHTRGATAWLRGVIKVDALCVGAPGFFEPTGEGLVTLQGRERPTGEANKAHEVVVLRLRLERLEERLAGLQ